jgi:hypothetical protein
LGAVRFTAVQAVTDNHGPLAVMQAHDGRVPQLVTEIPIIAVRKFPQNNVGRLILAKLFEVGDI